MSSLLGSTKNTRAILPDSLRFIRSDVPCQITQEETEWLVKNQITTIVDLRADEERLQKECPLIHNPRFQYYCMPVTGGNVVPQTTDDVSESYIHMVDAQMERIIDVIWNAPSNVLYFCNAGKDRTGVVSAILLKKMGLDMDFIVADYMESKHNLEEMLVSYAKENTNVDIEIIAPHERYIREFLAWWREQSI